MMVNKEKMTQIRKLLFVLSTILMLFGAYSCGNSDVSELYKNFKIGYDEYYELTFYTTLDYYLATTKYPQSFDDLYLVADESIKEKLKTFQKLYHPKVHFDEKSLELVYYLPGPDGDDNQLQEIIVSDFVNWHQIMSLKGDIVYCKFNDQSICSRPFLGSFSWDGGATLPRNSNLKELRKLNQLIGVSEYIDGRLVFWLKKTETGVALRSICGNDSLLLLKLEDINNFLIETNFIIGDSTVFYLGDEL